MYGLFDAEQEDGADGLLVFFKIIRTMKVHVDNKGTIDGLWRGERKCMDPKAGDADLWVKNLGRIAPLCLKRNCGGSGACQGAPHKERQEREVAI